MGMNYYARPKKPCLEQVVNPDGAVIDSRQVYDHSSLFRWKDGVEPESCECIDEKLGLHIMKCSYGWKVMFQAAPELGIATVDDIYTLFDTGKYDLVDEECRVVDKPVDAIKAEIANRSECLNSGVQGHSYMDPYGNTFILGDFS